MCQTKCLVSILQTAPDRHKHLICGPKHLWNASDCNVLVTFHLYVFNIFTPQIKKELLRIKSSSLQGCGLAHAAWKNGGDDLFLSSCYHDVETQTDLQIPKGVIFLTASNPVFFLLNITYYSNKKQVWSWNTALTHHRISPFS